MQQADESLGQPRLGDITFSSEEERFDRITRLAQRLFGVPIAVVSLVDAERQWFKSRQGLEATETPRDISFCRRDLLTRVTTRCPAPKVIVFSASEANGDAASHFAAYLLKSTTTNDTLLDVLRAQIAPQADLMAMQA